MFMSMLLSALVVSRRPRSSKARTASAMRRETPTPVLADNIMMGRKGAKESSRRIASSHSRCDSSGSRSHLLMPTTTDAPFSNACPMRKASCFRRPSVASMRTMQTCDRLAARRDQMFAVLSTDAAWVRKDRRTPAVSTSVTVRPFTVTCSSTTSRVVPGMDATRARRWPTTAFRNDDLPTFGCPMMATRGTVSSVVPAPVTGGVKMLPGSSALGSAAWPSSSSLADAISRTLSTTSKSPMRCSAETGMISCCPSTWNRRHESSSLPALASDHEERDDGPAGAKDGMASTLESRVREGPVRRRRSHRTMPSERSTVSGETSTSARSAD
mmetsp:Transcript_7425/g.23741  ORF Transcript_7425/g.23741 Transcript_7425/m.23741 type:complete len:328 (+) Transcript_7425:347-1330(+)